VVGRWFQARRWWSVGLLGITRQIARQWAAHNNTRSAAAIAFFAIFTLAPTLVLATVIASRFVSSKEAHEFVQTRLADTVGPAGAHVAQDILENVRFQEHRSFATIFSAILLLYGSSAMFYQMRTALDHVFHNKAQPPKRQAWITAILGRLLAALFVLGTGGLLVVMLLGTLALHWLENWLVQNTSFGGTGWQLTGGATSVVGTYVVFVAFLKLLPSNRPPLANVLPAAVIAVILFEMGRWLIGLYISHSVIATAYGPSSSIVAIVLWVFWTAQILLVAAEICAWSLDRRIKT